MSCNNHNRETENAVRLEEFLQSLRELVIYTLPIDCRDDEDIIETYFQSFLLACEDYKNLK